jgi:eukaryotic-like serine/threonine-protein kinase
VKSTIMLPDTQQLPGANTEVALSPDGTMLAFVSHGSDGKTHLWLRRMNSASAQPLEGTEGADAPFWSPDSRYIGFFANDRLQKIPAIGGTAVALCSTPDIRGVS